jgi:hypothetical protein
MAAFQITVQQFLDIITQEASDYINSDGENTPPTGGSVTIRIDPQESHTISISSDHNLVERLSDIFQCHFSPLPDGE